MVRSAVLLLLLLLPGLAAWCRAEVPPPTVNISLDEDPEVRWKPLLTVFDLDYLKKAGAEVIDSTIPKWVHHAVIPIVQSLEKYVPQPYAGEIRGLASHMGGNLADSIMLNFAYEVSAFCTSIIAQDKDGVLYHGRNLDYPHSVLKNLTVNVVFLKNGEVAYTGTTFAGYVGLWTGQSPHKFTISGDQRGTEHWWNWWKNFMSAFLYRRSPVSWLFRETLEEAEDFQDAVMRLSKTPLIAGVYYIVGGVRAGEGVVITRDREGAADIWPLDPVNGNWYRVETNFDHWLPPPATDHRREAANKALNATGQDHINMETLYQVLSLPPVCNSITVYTTLMSAAAPEKYSTLVRPQGCKEQLTDMEQ
ncbi:N-acylethanolamine-hydrolyzing acid amidase [Amphiprion ocellaris]|uniref:N-acylethanolamine-hydrolyzing acid amidase n=1 Tax=Amphiprion ocellaris TaxID=80972 RepID=A0AAQ5Y1P3_AMPOC|nr:N-acylethanolamine-hydrolyzing acid amidase [Amphiprion ocellaris]